MTNQTQLPGDLVEAVACAIYAEDNLNGLGEGIANAMRQRAISSITAMQAYLASDGVTQMDRDLFAHILLSMNGNEWVSEGELRDAPDNHPAFPHIIAHRRAAAITPQPDPRDQVIAELREVLGDLQKAEAAYRKAHDLHGDADRYTGRMWDLMRRAGDKARAALAKEPKP